MLGRRVGFHPGLHGSPELRRIAVRGCVKLRSLYRASVAGAREITWLFRQGGKARQMGATAANIFRGSGNSC